MSTIKIALVQKKAIPNNKNRNLELAVQYIKEASCMGADIVLFPEMWSNGYAAPFDGAFDNPTNPAFEEERKEWLESAVTIESDYVAAIKDAAQKYKIGVCATFLSKADEKFQNTAITIDRSGSILLNYAKVHTCDFDVERNLTPGEDFYVTDLDTAEGRVKVGAMICFDREFPESARILMLKGAELILVPNACPMEINRLAQLRGRAFENMLGIATCNYPNGQPDCNGHSSAFDGVAYLPEMTGSRDICILRAGSEEGIFLASFDLDMMREYRKSEVHGNAYRHPKKYGILVDERIEDPFVRGDYRA